MKQSTAEMILSVDFSLDTLDVSLRSQSGEWLWPHQAYSNNWTGFQNLKAELLAELKQHQPEQLTAAGESTGPYWWHLFYHLSQDSELGAYDPQLALLNPRHVKRFRKALPEQDKNDLMDPQLIERYYQTVGVKHPYQFNERYLHLRSLSRAYYRLVHTLAAEKAFVLSVLYLHCSEYQRLMPFSDVFGVTSQYVLTEYADIAAVADIELEPLAAQLDLIAKGTLPDAQTNAQRLHQVAQDAYPVPPDLAASLQQVLQFSLAHIRFLSDNQKAYQTLISQQLDRLPEAKLALDQPGLGPVLVAGFLSEIQDTQRFITGTKFDRKRKVQRPRTYRDGQAGVAKLAGLWWPQYASGRFQAKDLHLSHERNPYLRYWFVQAAHTLQRYQPDYRTYYRRKYNEARHHHHKRALVLTARKAVRLIFALLHKGQRSCLEELPTA
jgi:transposase